MTSTMFALGCAAGALAFAAQPYDLRFLLDRLSIQTGSQNSTSAKLDTSLITGSVATPAAATNLALRPSMPADAAEVESARAAPAPAETAQPETVAAVAGDPEALCASLTAVGFDDAQWQRDGNGEWSCTPEVARFGREGASLFATILGNDAETVSLVRLKLNLVSEAANDAIKRRAADLLQRLEKDLGWKLPAEAEAALLAPAAYQFADSRWQFVVRPQDSDPSRVNVFLRRAPTQKIDMRGGL
jgi:hypothetical protein